ncbi:MAG: CBS domain-containing protein [Bacteroidales bacterium]|nr:CBS domain-containing protein [Bacteroidales bacterium]
MLAKNLINEYVPLLRTSDTGKEALQYMEIFKLSHLPIVNNEILLGVISENDIYDMNEPQEPLGNHNLNLKNSYVYANQHLYEVAQQMYIDQLTLIPVINEKKEYLGSITLKDLLKGLVKVTNIEKYGSIVVLEMNIRDYSLVEISQIIESENAKILSSYIAETEDSTKIEVTLKINVEDISRIISSFNRYNYIIKYTFVENSDLQQFYQDRLDQFFKFLSI